MTHSPAVAAFLVTSPDLKTPDHQSWTLERRQERARVNKYLYYYITLQGLLVWCIRAVKHLVWWPKHRKCNRSLLRKKPWENEHCITFWIEKTLLERSRYSRTASCLGSSAPVVSWILLNLPPERTDAPVRGEQLVLQVLEERAGVFGQIRQLAQGPGQSHITEGAQVLEQETVLIRVRASTQPLGLHDPLGKWHFVM